MKRALVTGAHGFCGKHLTRYLTELGMEVHTLGSGGTTSALHHRIDDIACSASIGSVLNAVNPDYIFHLAGIACSSDPTLFYKVNTEYAVALLHALESGGFGSCPVLLVGTAAEYGTIGPEELPIREDLAPHPYNHYGISKLAQTFAGLTAGRRGHPIVIARPFNIIGPGMPAYLVAQNFSRQIVEVLCGRIPPIMRVGNLDSTRDFIDVRDAVRIYWQLLQTPEAYGTVVNICSGKGILIKEMLSKLIAISGVAVEVTQDPSLLKPVDVPVHFGSNEKLQKLIGFVPNLNLEVTLNDILRDLLAGEEQLLRKGLNH